MYTISIIGDQEPFADIQAFARRYPDLVLSAAQRRVEPRGQRLVQQRLAQAEPPPRGPSDRIRWTSEKQRRAFFATDGFGNGIPYRRKSPGLSEMWRFVVNTTANGLTASVTNSAPAAPFVVGRWQQGFHADHGWPLARPIILDIGKQLEPIITELQRDVFAELARAR